MHCRPFPLEILHLHGELRDLIFNWLDLDGDLLSGNSVRLERLNLGPDRLELLGHEAAEALDGLDLRRADDFFERDRAHHRFELHRDVGVRRLLARQRRARASMSGMPSIEVRRGGVMSCTSGPSSAIPFF